MVKSKAKVVKKQCGPDSAVVQIVLAKTTKEWLTEHADRETLSLSSYLRRLVETHVREARGREARRLDSQQSLLEG